MTGHPIFYLAGRGGGCGCPSGCRGAQWLVSVGPWGGVLLSLLQRDGSSRQDVDPEPQVYLHYSTAWLTRHGQALVLPSSDPSSSVVKSMCSGVHADTTPSLAAGQRGDLQLFCFLISQVGLRIKGDTVWEALHTVSVTESGLQSGNFYLDKPCKSIKDFHPSDIKD